ncbi:MAG: hypothetical protein B6U88_02135 [Candidatus Aenigmarchaeota archaeon ex4484_56]|nr:MAG: hypothetical protein B6U88_02135 [Candidatus Aenigmarchaeota archaeon ex4484_56]
MDSGVVGFVLFFVILGAILYIKRDKIERQGIILLYRTKEFRKIIENISKKYEKFWDIYFKIGIVVCIFAMIFGIYYTINSTINIFLRTITPGFALVLPYPGSDFSYKPGLFLAPIWYWVIAIAVLIIPHELSHGIALVINKLKIKSVGLFLLLFIPGAFVEPDEKKLKKADKLKKLQVYCAGSFSNLVTALLILLLLHLSLFSFYSGSYYSHPATQINKTDTMQIQDTTENLTKVITFKDAPASNRNFIKHISREFYMGINFIIMVCIGVAIFNLLPIKPLDGGYILEILTNRKIANIVSIIFVIIVIYNIVGPMII